MTNNYYVYEWSYTNGTPSYIGKGKGNRCNIETQGRNRYFKRTIKNIRMNGGEPKMRVLFDDLYEDEAFILEIALIRNRNIR